VRNPTYVTLSDGEIRNIYEVRLRNMKNEPTRFNFSVKTTGGAQMARGVGKAFVAEVSRQVEQDIPIWENKVQHDMPILCDGDGPIASFRKWCTQFYTYPDSQEAAE